MIKDKLNLLEDKPGCYLMYDKDNVIIYVGKAKSLKNRVSQYFLKPLLLVAKKRLCYWKII